MTLREMDKRRVWSRGGLWSDRLWQLRSSSSLEAWHTQVRNSCLPVSSPPAQPSGFPCGQGGTPRKNVGGKWEAPGDLPAARGLTEFVLQHIVLSIIVTIFIHVSISKVF